MALTTDFLKDIPLFQLMEASERVELANQLELTHFQEGEHVFHFGDPGDAVYIIREGLVEAYFKNDTGERMLLEQAGPGEFFGELAFLEGGSRNASIVAVTATQAFRLTHKNFERFLQSHPRAAIQILAAMSRRLRQTVEQLRHTATRNVNIEEEDKRTLVQKAADGIAAFAGSIPFLCLHVAWFSSWIFANTIGIPGIPRFDPFPFGLLTLSVSLEAIFLSVFVLLSQNRQAAKERIRADVEYDVNLKAELEIGHLHEKLDRLNAETLRRLEKIQSLLGERPARKD